MVGSNWQPTGNHTLRVHWRPDRWRHVTPKGQHRDHNFSGSIRRQLCEKGGCFKLNTCRKQYIINFMVMSLMWPMMSYEWSKWWQIAVVAAPRSEDPKLIIRVITFELVQLLCPGYINVTDRRTDGRTDGRLTIAIPRFALRASRGKKDNFKAS